MAQKRVLLAMDQANLYWYASQNGERICYEALLAYAAELGRLTHSAIYVARPKPDQDRAFLLKLKDLGFSRVVARALRQRPEGRSKSDIDTIMAMDLWQAVLKRETDSVALVSGDSDFVPLVEGITARGTPVCVIGPNGSTAWELKVAATHFVDARDVPGLLEPMTEARLQMQHQQAV